MRIHAKQFYIRLTATVVLSSFAAARLQADEPLRWKFEVGEKLDYDMVQEMNMSSAGGANTTMHQELNMTWDVQGVNEKGDAVIKQKFDRVKMKMATAGGGFEYDSKSEAVPTGLGAMIAPMYKAMTQGEFEITMTSRGKVTDVKVPEEVLAALKSSPGAAMMGDIASADGFKKMMSQGALVLPEKASKPGDMWSTKVDMNNAAVGTQSVRTIYRYEGTKNIDGAMYAVIKPHLKMDFPSNAKFKEVFTLKGNGMKKSPPFALTGADARIKYKYTGSAGAKSGMFAAYVVDEGKEIAKTGDFPEVMTTAQKEEGDTSLQKDAGKYYLDIASVGDWEVSIEEVQPESKADESPKPDQPAKPQQPKPQQKLTMKIANQSSDGEVLFNIAKGRLASTSLQQKVAIDATAGGQTAQQKIDQKIEVKVIPSGEKKPEEAKKPGPAEKKSEASEKKTIPN